jgi:DNA-binding SARP family transcriptional activator
VVEKFREILTVSKPAAQTVDIEWFNLRKLNELEVRKQYRIKISNRFAALENLSDNEDVNWSLENIKDNIKTTAKENLGLYELKQRKQWFGE